MKVIFVRHGERGPGDSLTEKGRIDAVNAGYNLVESGLFARKDTIEAYSGQRQRVIDTVKAVLYGAHREDVPVGVLESLGKMGSFTKEFLELLKKDPMGVADSFMDGTLTLPGQITSQEVAKGIAGVICHQNMQNRAQVYINGTHQVHPESLLVRLGLPKLSEVGGPLKTLETVVFSITMPNKELDVNYTFRGKTYQTSYGDIWEIAGRPEFVEVI